MTAYEYTADNGEYMEESTQEFLSTQLAGISENPPQIDVLLKMLPSAARPYAKAVVGTIGFVGIVAVLTVPGIPSWVSAAVSGLTALGVYRVPNES